MKKLMVWALAVLPFAMLAIATSSASAAFEYLCGGEAILTAGNCLTRTINLQPLTLEDMSADAGVYCVPEAVTDEDEVISATVENETEVKFAEGGCKPLTKALSLENKEVANACTQVDDFNHLDLPWETKIEEESGANNYWVLIKKGPGAAGEPGYETVCETSLGLIADKCTSPAANTALVLVENLLTETEELEGVKNLKLGAVIFNEETLEGAKEWATCTIGGKESGLVIGEVLIRAINATSGKPVSLEIS